MRLSLLCAAIVGLAACSGGNSGAVRELMKSPIAPASDAIFNAVAYTNGRLVAAPQDDAAWSRLREQAQSLNQSADRLTTLAPAANNAEWLKQSAALKTSALDVEHAVERRDLDQILSAGGDVYATCTRCHAAYIED